MLDKLGIARQLNHVLDLPAVYLKVEPELPDFSIHKNGVLKLYTHNQEITIPFDRHTIQEVMALLDVSIFTGEKTVLAWNFKNLISYVLRYSKRPRTYPCRLFDLKLLEGFMADRKSAPKDFAEAFRRLSVLAKNKVWKPVYEKINLPLITRVVPQMEVEGIVDLPNRRIAYAHYEIDRTPSGRMVCQLPGKGYNPHGLGSNDNYKPRGEDEVFLYFDHRAMEIRILQWLSGDENLKTVIDSPDIYAAAWKKVTTHDDPPEIWKSTFLAMLYGLGAEELGRRHGWGTEAGKKVIGLSRAAFPEAFGYVTDAQERARLGPVSDHFGRPRDVTESPYLARNHVIQSAANVVCMEKLILLSDNMPDPARLAYSVHDGYCLFCERKALRDVIPRCVGILESPSEMCPGLGLGVTAKAGSRLSKMVELPISWRG